MAADAPLWLKLVTDLVLLVAVLGAFAGRPPKQRPSARIISLVGALGATGWFMGFADVIAGYGECEPLLGPSVLALCLARWMARGPAGGGGGGGGTKKPEDDGPGPKDQDSLDWDAFDRAREDWSRPKIPN